MKCHVLISIPNGKYQAWCTDQKCLWESDAFDFKWQAERAREKHTGQEPVTHPPWQRGPAR